MRRAVIEERQLEALRLRCADVGARLVIEVDRSGDATLVIGASRFDEWPDAVAHVDALEGAAQEAA